MDIISELLDTWQRNHKTTLYLLDNIETDWLKTKLNNKGRSVGEQFVHINNIRSFWINKVGEKQELKVDKRHSNDEKVLTTVLNQSSKAMHKTLTAVLTERQIKGYKPHPSAFFAQMIAHESHHRGQVLFTINRNGLEISRSVNFGLWNWNR